MALVSGIGIFLSISLLRIGSGPAELEPGTQASAWIFGLVIGLFSLAVLTNLIFSIFRPHRR